jgi:4-alpha-glucanotransferase
MAADRYAWWKSRIRAALRMVDIIRIDHFRGFEAYWAVPADHDTAMHGRWEAGPGLDFFTELRADLGALPLIAEDLGDITPAVLALRKQAGLPGMNVLQFAFDGNTKNPYLPYNVERDSVMYTGTHDNNTSLGWFQSLSGKQRARVCDYLGVSPRDFIDSFLRAASSSPAALCVIPLQDILHLDGTHRMNTPGTGNGNWSWRVHWDMIDAARLDRLKTFTHLYGRAD